MAHSVAEVVAPPARKPSDDELDVYGLTHPGKVRSTNQDHFLICSLRKQMLVHLTSLPAIDQVVAPPERLAFLAMVADGVGGSAGGETASRLAVEVVTRYVSQSVQCYYASGASDDSFLTALQDAAMQSHADLLAWRMPGPSWRAWPQRSRSGSAYGLARICSRWATAGAISFAAASSPRSRATRPWPRS